ncbi:Serine/threonine-protein kinase PknK [compost metagenome]
MSSTHDERLALRWVRRLIGMPVLVRNSMLALLALRNKMASDLARTMLHSSGTPFALLEHPPQALMAAQYIGTDPGTRSDVERRIGQHIGPWKIAALVGMGGMGAVYRASRSDGTYERDVAIKFIQHALTTPAARNAFMTERNALARLNHRDIVPILDGGVDVDGTPWFVMPLLDGSAIDQWCDQNRKSIRERVELVTAVCQALAYAHSRGVLHQDIKPSAVLIDADGTPKLLDFGLAEISGSTPSTTDAARQHAYSPGFGAPELLAGARPSAAIDIFGMGALMCFLLCGRTPATSSGPASFLLTGMPPAPPPSELAADADAETLQRRNCRSVRALRRQLQGDLDAIVQRCTAADPDARYPTIQALHEDLDHWLRGHPVSIRSGTFYRLKLFVRRNALQTTLALLAVGSSALLGGAALWQQYQTRQEQEVSTRADHLFSQSLAAAAMSQTPQQPLTATALLERTESNLRRFAAKDPADVLARGLSILARSQTDAGNYAKAETLASESLTLESGPSLQFAFNQVTIARLQNLRAHHDIAEREARQGLQRLGYSFTNQEKVAQLQLHMQLAVAQEGQDQPALAMATLNDAIQQASALKTPAADIALAQMLIVRGNWHRRRLKVDAAMQDLERAIDLARQTEPSIVDDARESLIRATRASRLPQRDARALAVANTLLQSRSATLGTEHPLTGVAWGELAFMEMLGQQLEAAQVSTDNAERILRTSFGTEHTAYARVLVAKSHLMTFASRLDEAMDYTQRALSIVEKNYGKSHELALEARFLLANQYWWKSRVEPSAFPTALKLMEEAIHLYQKRNGEVPAIHRTAYADMLAENKRFDEARHQIALAKADAARQYGDSSEELLHSRSTEIDIRIGAGESESIYPEIDRLIADTRKTDSLYARSIEYETTMLKAGLQQDTADIEGARASFTAARNVALAAGIVAWVKKVDIHLQALDDSAKANK